MLAQMTNNRSTYIFNSFWESGLEFAVQFMVIGFVASQFVRVYPRPARRHAGDVLAIWSIR